MVVVGTTNPGNCQRRERLGITGITAGSFEVGQPPSLFNNNKSTTRVLAMATQDNNASRDRGYGDRVSTDPSQVFSDSPGIAACQKSGTRTPQCFIRQGELQGTVLADRRRQRSENAQRDDATLESRSAFGSDNGHPGRTGNSIRSCNLLIGETFVQGSRKLLAKLPMKVMAKVAFCKPAEDDYTEIRRQVGLMEQKMRRAALTRHRHAAPHP